MTSQRPLLAKVAAYQLFYLLASVWQSSESLTVATATMRDVNPSELDMPATIYIEKKFDLEKSFNINSYYTLVYIDDGLLLV